MPGSPPASTSAAKAHAYAFSPQLSPDGTAGRVSAVVVHYRGLDDLRRCVAALGRSDWPDLEIIVVDNGSRDGLPAGLRVRRVVLPSNVGFAAGANAGMQVATGSWIFLVNPDAEVDPACVRELATADVDAAAARVLLRDHPDRLDNCGHELYPDGLNWCRGRGERAAGRYEEPEEVLLFSGAAVLLRRSALVAAGLFDPSYWAFGEDADLSLRLAARGLTCWYVPSAVVRHAVGASFGRTSMRKVFLVERNRARVAVTHLPLRWLAASPGWTLVRHLIMARGAAAGEGLAASWPPARRMLLPGVVAAAHLASLIDLPAGLRRRRSRGGRLDVDRLTRSRASTAALAGRPSGV
jgi:GT2 family glycosyltransferase